MTTDTGVHIRRAVPADLDLLVRLTVDTFRETYGPRCPIDEVESHIELNFTPSQIEADLADPRSTVFLVMAGDAPVGYVFVQIGSTTACVTGPAPVKLVRIYVAERVIGRGHGAALMTAAIEEAVARGGRTLWLSVWDENHTAIRFYEKWGFTHVGTQDFEFGGTTYRDPVMARELP